MSRPLSKNPKYQAIHVWLRTNFGKASKCENDICKKKSSNYQWALIKGKECLRIRENFWMLCASCHTKYDKKKDTNEKIRNYIINHLPKICVKGHIPWNKEKKLHYIVWNKKAR